MIQDKATMEGKVLITLLDEHGKVKEEKEFKNLVVTTGLTLTASRLLSNTDDVPSHMAIGSGSTPAAAVDTALETEVTRVALTSAANVANVITFVGTYGAGVGTGVITEAGIFNAASVGTLLNRVTFGSVNKGALDTMLITWTLTIG